MTSRFPVAHMKRHMKLAHVVYECTWPIEAHRRPACVSHAFEQFFDDGAIQPSLLVCHQGASAMPFRSILTTSSA